MLKVYFSPPFFQRSTVYLSCIDKCHQQISLLLQLQNVTYKFIPLFRISPLKLFKEDTLHREHSINLRLKTYSNNFVFKTLNLIDRILIMISAKSAKRNAKRLVRRQQFRPTKRKKKKIRL